jgi:hypothetical protein
MPVQLFVDELDDDAADELGDGAAQLVPDERLERLPGRHGHAWSLRPSRAVSRCRATRGYFSQRVPLRGCCGRGRRCPARA